MRKALTYVEIDVPLFIAEQRAVNVESDYAKRGGGLTGAVDGKQLTFVGWIYIASGSSGRLIAGVSTLGGTTGLTRVALDANNSVFLIGNNAAATVICDIRSSPLTSDVWHHVMISVDLSDTGKRHIYIDGVSNLAVITTYTNDTLDLTIADWGVLNYPGGGVGTQFSGGAADFWFDDSYIDFSLLANREKFLRNGQPTLLGFTGERPTGSSPLIFMSGEEDVWHMNVGTGGGFTLTGEFGSGYYFALNFEETFRFALPADYLPHFDIDAISCMTSVDYTPAKISLGENLGIRASVTASFKDFLHVFGEDTYEQGTFWSKWRGRYGIKLRGRNFRLIRGFLGETLESMDTRHYVIENTAGPSINGAFTIEAKDIVKLADEDRAQAPVVSNGTLAGSISNSATSLTLSPQGVGHLEYPESGYLSIGGTEVVAFVRPDGDDIDTLLLCHYDGVDESTTAADFDSDGIFYTRVATRFGNVKIDSAQSVFGGTAAFFDGTGDAITYSDSDDWRFTDFTIDARIRITSLAATRTIACQGTGSDRWQFRVETNGSLTFFEIAGGVTTISVGSAAGLILVNTWYHVAITRSGNIFRLLINGVVVATLSSAFVMMANFAAALAVGAQSDGTSEPFIGWIDEIRISKIARWVANFTVPSIAYRSGDSVDITRGQFGSVAQGHNSGDRVQLAIRYSGNDPADIIRDLMVNYAGVPSSYIELAEWQAETAANLAVIYAATITEPTSVRLLINELIEQAALAVWWDERALKVRLIVLREIATDTDTFDETRILAGSLSVTENPLKRISQQWTFYGQRDPTEGVDDDRNYRAGLASTDLIKQSEYGTPEIRQTRARWIETETAATRLNSIKLSRYRDPPRTFGFDLMIGEQVTAAAGYLLEWWGNRSMFGSAIAAKIQVTQVKIMPDRIHIEAEEMLASGVIVLVNVVFLTTTGSLLQWEVDAGWNDADNSVETIGGAGAGGNGGTNGGAGGGGGAYSSVSNLNLTPLALVDYRVGTGGASAGVSGTDTWFNGASIGASSVGAKGGTGAGSVSSIGIGGQAASGVGATKFSGGNGGPGANRGESRAGSGGGGAAAGPHGNGGNGGGSTGTSIDSGSGGGGADGGDNGVTQGSGGNNRFNFGGGTGANSAGDEGGGGSGGGSNSSSGGPGGNGEQLWTQTVAPITSAGPGGGGGGAGNGYSGGDGGLYGGAGGGESDGTAGIGRQGIIVITWRGL